MSREIKFRAWMDYGNHAEMIHNIQNHINGNWAFGYLLDNRVHGVDVKVMQYIGLKDIDECEICESDVCEIMYYTPFGDKTNEFYGSWVVKKWMGMFVLVSGKERLSFTDFANVTNTEYVPNLGTVAEFSEKVNVRVIGNIHEHKHLIYNN